MYEAEYKVEITEEERTRLMTLFLGQGFINKGVVKQNDYYTEVFDSPFGGYDFKRYRDESGKYFYTAKTFEIVDGKAARREDEKEISKEEFIEAISKYPNATKINKERQLFLGRYNDKEIHIDMDSVKFDHSPAVRYFIEAEIVTNDREQASNLKNEMADFIKSSLGRSEIIEAPGMFTMAYKKI